MIPADSRVLVIIVARIGDTLLVTPALRAIREACPRGMLTCMAHPSRLEVLENLPFVDDLCPITKTRARWRGWLRGKKWDYAFVYGHDVPLLRYAIRVSEHVVAFRQSASIDRLLYRAVPPPSETMHAVRERLLLPAAVGIEARDLRLAYRPTEAELASARERLPRGATPLVGFQLASFPTKSYRDWPVENFVEVGRRIVSISPGARILLLGSTARDREKAEAVRAKLPEVATSLVGECDLRETAAVMDHLDLYVGVDTGPTHLAGALGIPMVALYHCRHRGRHLAPLDHPRLRIIEHPGSDGDAAGMEAIGVETVWKAVKETLSFRKDSA